MSAIKPKSRPIQQVAKPKSNIRVVFIIGCLLMLLILKKIFGVISYNFFVTGDHFLLLSPRISPFFMWGVIGLLIGAVIGSFVVWKKYKLPFKWNLPAIVVFALVSISLYLNSSPLTNNYTDKTIVKRNGSDFVEVSASHSIPDYERYTYGPENLIDTDETTAWMFNGSAKTPESVSFVFTREKISKIRDIKLTGIRIQPGYAKTYKKWESMNKPKDYVIYKNGTQIGAGTLADHFGYELIPLDAIKITAGDTIRLNINSVYRGSNKKANITAITTLYPEISYSEALF